METSYVDVPILESVPNDALGRMKMQIDIFLTKKKKNLVQIFKLKI